MEQTVIPQIDGTNPNPNPDAVAMSLTGDTATDLQNIAKEMGVQLDPSGNVVGKAPVAVPTPAQQAQPAAQGQPAVTEQPAPQENQPVAVPPKFQNPDGTVNEANLDKSTRTLEERIAKFRELEKTHSQLQNKANNPQVQEAVQQSQAPGFNVPLSPLEIQVARDLIASHNAVGLQLSDAQAIAQARVQVRLQEARLEAERSTTEQLRRRVEDNDRRVELQDLANNHPELMTDEMAEKLWAIRQANPEINRSQTPWRDALIRHLGEMQLYGRASQVQTPNPTGLTAKAPPTPVGPVTRVLPQVDTKNPKNLSDDQLLAEIKKIHPNFRNR